MAHALKPTERTTLEWEDLETGLHYAVRVVGTRNALNKLCALLVEHPKIMNAWRYGTESE